MSEVGSESALGDVYFMSAIRPITIRSLTSRRFGFGTIAIEVSGFLAPL